MKKFTYLAIMTAMLLLCMRVNTLAEALTVLSDNDGLYIENNTQRAVINFYQKGKLVQSIPSEQRQGGLFFNVQRQFYNCDMRAVFFDGSSYDVELKAISDTENTSEKTSEIPKETTEPTKKSYPEVYEKSSDATHAPALVERVETTSLDGEIYYRLTMLYQGEDVQTDVGDWVEIETAPAICSSVKDKNASALRPGDVIHFACNMQGQIKSINLIYRPEFIDYIAEDISLSKVVGADNRNQYYFGVPVETKKGYMLLADALGNTHEIDLDTKTFVYTVSGSRKNIWYELTGVGYAAVTKTYIPRSSFDDNGKVTSWNDVEDKTYALVRVASDKATEVFVFVND